MMKITSKRFQALAFGVALLAAGMANAATVLCPAGTDGNRQGSLETDPGAATCLDYGTGNVGQGNPLNDDFLNGSGELGNGAGWSLVFSDNTNLGYPKTVSGIDWTGYSRLALFFKVGGGNYCPTGLVCTGNRANRTGETQEAWDWFVFELPTDETSAIFNVINNNATGGGLSHWGLYGIEGSTEVPVPGTLGLLGLGLVGLGFARRKQQKA